MSVRSSNQGVVARNALQLLDVRILCLASNNVTMIADALMMTKDKIHGIVETFAKQFDHFCFKIGSFCLKVHLIIYKLNTFKLP